MKRQIGLSQLLGLGFTSVFGTLLHYLYDWSGSALWLAPFSGVNESTWEHMKLLFWPMFIYAMIQWIFFRDREDFWCVKLRGILCGLILIPVISLFGCGVLAIKMPVLILFGVIADALGTVLTLEIVV